eukprot:821986-Prorocentrum_minimum.AAC.3
MCVRASEQRVAFGTEDCGGHRCMVYELVGARGMRSSLRTKCCASRATAMCTPLSSNTSCARLEGTPWMS